MLVFFRKCKLQYTFWGKYNSHSGYFFSPSRSQSQKRRVCNVCSMVVRLKIFFSWKEGKPELEAKHGKNRSCCVAMCYSSTVDKT